MRRLWVFWLLIAAAPVGIAAVPTALEARERPEARKAHAMFAEGKRLFRAGRVRDALARFEEARALASTPDIVWSIARCHEELGEVEAAVRTYEEFERQAPGPGARTEARRKIAALRARLPAPETETPGEARTEPPAAEPPVAEPPAVIPPADAAPPAPAEAPAPVVAEPAPSLEGTSGLKAGLFWGGLGALVLGAGLNVWGYLEYRKVDDASHTWAQKKSARDSAAWKYYTAYALYGVGGAAVVASFLVPASGRHPLGIGAVPLPGGGAVVATLEW